MKIITSYKEMKAGKVYKLIVVALFLGAIISLANAISWDMSIHCGVDPSLSLILLLGAFLVIGFRKAYNKFIKRMCGLVSLEITDDKVIGSYGSFYKKSLTIPIEQLDNIVIVDGLFDKCFSGNTLSVTSNNGSIKFPFVQNAEEFSEFALKKIKEYKDNYGLTSRNINKISIPNDKPISSENNANNSSTDSGIKDYIEELVKLNDLLSKGIISQEEFDAKKKQVLGL